MRRGNQLHAMVLIPLVVSSGCTMIQAQSRVDPQTVASYSQLSIDNAKSCTATKLNGDTRLGAIDLDCLQFPETVTREDSTLTFAPTKIGQRGVLAYAAAQADKDHRNRLAAILMKQSDDICTQEMARLTANEAMVNAGLSIVGNGLSTTAAIVTGNLAKSILAGGASFANATRGHIDAEVYRNALSTAVGKAISAKREGLANSIRTHRSDSIGTYSVDDMILDVNAYHQSCSFYLGLQLVVEAVDKAAPSIASRSQGLANAINTLELRTADIDRQLSALPADDARRAPLVEERKALVEKHQGLVTEEASLFETSGTATPTVKSDGSSAASKTGSAATTAANQSTSTAVTKTSNTDQVLTGTSKSP